MHTGMYLTVFVSVYRQFREHHISMADLVPMQPSCGSLLLLSLMQFKQVSLALDWLLFIWMYWLLAMDAAAIKGRSGSLLLQPLSCVINLKCEKG